jgi:Ca2+-binding EF-hand superfamily protein
MLPKQSTRTLTRRNLLIALAGASGAVAASAIAQKPATTAPTDRFALANNDVKELLLLMDADKNGKISKQEWMNFMEAEFNQLDKDGKGELDLKQLSQSRLVVKHNNS